MKEKVEVAVIQMAPVWMQPAQNREIMLEKLNQAVAAKRIDLAVLPELANSGYVKGRDKDFCRKFAEAAEPVPGPTTDALGRFAREHGMHIIVGMCVAHPDVPHSMYNSAVLIGPSGDVIGIHHKMHTAGEEKHYFYPGNSAPVFKTDLGTIGMLVCYDNWFPELARVLTLKGAEILCGVFAGAIMKSHVERRMEALATVRASENRNFVVMCNRVGVEDGAVFWGHSVVAAPTGHVIAQSNSSDEEILFATLDRESLVEERSYWAVFRDRRPDMYSELTKPL